jgi:predicted esterase
MYIAMPSSASLERAETVHFPYTGRGRYLLHVPETPAVQPLLILTLHGYGSSPEAMLRLSLPTVGESHYVAALQGPHQHYQTAEPGTDSGVGYNWGTRLHGEENIRLHHEMVRSVLHALRDRFGVPPWRCLLMGFSQPVGLNYRFSGTYPEEIGGVLGICGGIPRDWQEDKYKPAPPLLHIARGEDEYFPASTVESYPERFGKHAADVEFHLLEGGHKYPSKARSIVQPWLARVFGV